MSNAAEASRRKFIEKLFSKLGALSVGGFFLSKHAEAIEHLKNLPNPLNDEMQKNLLIDSKRQMLIAEDSNCTDKSFGPPAKMKMKCLGGWGDI